MRALPSSSNFPRQFCSFRVLGLKTLVVVADELLSVGFLKLWDFGLMAGEAVIVMNLHFAQIRGGNFCRRFAMLLLAIAISSEC